MLSQDVGVCHYYEGVRLHTLFLSYTGSYVEGVDCKQFVN
jgi:hypothetical protein